MQLPAVAAAFGDVLRELRQRGGSAGEASGGNQYAIQQVYRGSLASYRKSTEVTRSAK